MSHRRSSPTMAVLLAVLVGGVLLLPTPAATPAVGPAACHAVLLGTTAFPLAVRDIAVALPSVRGAPLTAPIHGSLPATTPAESRCPTPSAYQVLAGAAASVDDGRTRGSSVGSRAPPVARF
jgi:hypothetical protein